MFSEQLALILMLAASNGANPTPSASPDPAVRSLQVRVEQNALKKHLETRLANHRLRHASHVASSQQAQAPRQPVIVAIRD
ncbi:MAG: hypothetical protein AB1899_03355 [Pseudomonadota bacterium]